MKFLRWIGHKLIVFFKIVWECIKSFNTPKGIISFFISFMVCVGWALGLIVYGTMIGHAGLIGIGTAVVGFWAIPVITPMWAIIITLTYILQKFVLRDKQAMSKEKIKELVARFK